MTESLEKDISQHSKEEDIIKYIDDPTENYLESDIIDNKLPYFCKALSKMKPLIRKYYNKKKSYLQINS